MCGELRASTRVLGRQNPLRVTMLDENTGHVDDTVPTLDISYASRGQRAEPEESGRLFPHHADTKNTAPHVTTVLSISGNWTAVMCTVTICCVPTVSTVKKSTFNKPSTGSCRHWLMTAGPTSIWSPPQAINFDNLNNVSPCPC